jgi:hypothetical protein
VVLCRPFRCRAIGTRTAGLALLVLTVACEDAVDVEATQNAASAPAGVAAVTPGITRDSLFRLIGDGPIQPRAPYDTIAVVHGYRAQLLVLPNALYHVLWHRAEAAPHEAPPDRTRDTPILLGSGRVIAAGWEAFDRAVTDLQLPVQVPTLGPAAPPTFGPSR